MPLIAHGLGARTLSQGAALMETMTVMRANDCDSSEGEAVNADTLC